MKSATSATKTLALLRPPTILATKTLSPSLRTQLKSRTNLKTIVSPTPGPQVLAALTVTVIAMIVPQEKEKLTTRVASPAH